ncbi:PREDICTED: serine protease 40-like [Myotis brandtii]|uniref:serine protease 40-like n=1 Tax=Myotis brandtii TaxID=109478 RepID=UPI0007047677|nr:PREDICTED: serine protease 40-like [Myotis brandtii]
MSLHSGFMEAARLCLKTGTISTVCGRPVVTGKIFGGKNASDQRWPWQASLLYHGKHICGAALISAFWVISAAHCFQKSHEPSDYKILLGYHKLQHPTEHSLQMTVYRVIVHDDFNKRYIMGSDIALLLQLLVWAAPENM